jgi:hypothetical protein
MCFDIVTAWLAFLQILGGWLFNTSWRLGPLWLGYMGLKQGLETVCK